ncbi:hypothetical protein AGR2A_pa20007 [Agrobacterium genomosp. 2 str. CFBP 5494]|uniref:Uncharacterized protein n=1 Tax=Agrobacterium genomosp. 2 str. CFBP 5494 TaxID=1183436 RepID=A0A9W5B6H0_9HYPH|nr:hypothetical protein AGR2A_pa20007 [Agrobacterium genomosp. 2 str. CFBP 5494]
METDLCDASDTMKRGLVIMGETRIWIEKALALERLEIRRRIR